MALPGAAWLRFARPHYFHDPLSDIWSQNVPVCYQLAGCFLLPAIFRPVSRRHVVTACAVDACGICDAGAIPAASIVSAVTFFLEMTQRH